MRDRYVVDTNVLIAASAAHPLHPKDIDATPAEPELRLMVWRWLTEFETGMSRLVLDYRWGIRKEYERNLTPGDYGIQVLQSKWDKAQVDFVAVEYDSDDCGVLPASLLPIIHDTDDRKMVAAALASHADFGEGCVAFAGDTDWHDWEEALAKHEILLEPIIEAWSRQKHAEKKQR